MSCVNICLCRLGNTCDGPVVVKHERIRLVNWLVCLRLITLRQHYTLYQFESTSPAIFIDILMTAVLFNVAEWQQ